MMVIASRMLTLRGASGKQEIPVRIFAPQPERIDWSCRFEIDWPDGTLTRTAVGVDAVQSLVLALQMIGTVIYASDYHNSGRLAWGETGAGYGFPVPHNVRDLLIGDDPKFF